MSLQSILGIKQFNIVFSMIPTRKEFIVSTSQTNLNDSAILITIIYLSR